MPISRIKILNIVVTLNELLNNDGFSHQPAKLGDYKHCGSEYMSLAVDEQNFSCSLNSTITFFSLKHMA